MHSLTPNRVSDRYRKIQGKRELKQDILYGPQHAKRNSIPVAGLVRGNVPVGVCWFRLQHGV